MILYISKGKDKWRTGTNQVKSNQNLAGIIPNPAAPCLTSRDYNAIICVPNGLGSLTSRELCLWCTQLSHRLRLVPLQTCSFFGRCPVIAASSGVSIETDVLLSKVHEMGLFRASLQGPTIQFLVSASFHDPSQYCNFALKTSIRCKMLTTLWSCTALWKCSSAPLSQLKQLLCRDPEEALCCCPSVAQ